jgi:hypothetical protein
VVSSSRSNRLMAAAAAALRGRARHLRAPNRSCIYSERPPPNPATGPQ